MQLAVYEGGVEIPFGAFMTRASSATFVRATCLAAVACALLGVSLGLSQATASPTSSADRVAVSLVQSSTAVPLGGTLGFTGQVRFPSAASSVQARLQLRRQGRLLYQRTQYLDSTEEGLEKFEFERPLEGLGLDPGSYPVTFSLRATVGGSSVTTEVTRPLRIFDPKKPQVPVAIVAKIHARPMLDASAEGFSVDPSSTAATRVRDQVDRISQIVLLDPEARISLAVPPIVIQEWRRMATSGYTLASGTVVPQTDPIVLTYAQTLTHLQQALSTGRLELLSLGLSDPNLADLAGNKLAFDAADQYDAGYSAIYTSLEATPAHGTAPAGGAVPRSVQRALLGRHVAYAFVDGDSVKNGKKAGVATGAYRCAESSLTVLVVDAKASRGVESSEDSQTLADTFDRAGDSSPQPVILRVDLDDTVWDATNTVGFAVASIEGAPWARLASGSELSVPKGAKPVTAVPRVTKNAPVGYWSAIHSASVRAGGMIAILSASDSDAARSQLLALLAESNAWSEPSTTWSLAREGLAFAKGARDIANSVLEGIKVSATSVTFAGQTGNIPVTVTNGSKKTLTAVVYVKTTGGVKVVGGRSIPTRLPPRDTFVQIPIDMQSALYGKVTVQVLAGNVVVAKQTVAVRRSYLDRLALIGTVVLVLGGMLAWIVIRVLRSPDTDEPLEPEDEPQDSSLSAEDSESEARYTDGHTSDAK